MIAITVRAVMDSAQPTKNRVTCKGNHILFLAFVTEFLWAQPRRLSSPLRPSAQRAGESRPREVAVSSRGALLLCVSNSLQRSFHWLNLHRSGPHPTALGREAPAGLLALSLSLPAARRPQRAPPQPGHLRGAVPGRRRAPTAPRGAGGPSNWATWGSPPCPHPRRCPHPAFWGDRSPRTWGPRHCRLQVGPGAPPPRLLPHCTENQPSRGGPAATGHGPLPHNWAPPALPSPSSFSLIHTPVHNPLHLLRTQATRLYSLCSLLGPAVSGRDGVPRPGCLCLASSAVRRSQGHPGGRPQARRELTGWPAEPPPDRWGPADCSHDPQRPSAFQ